LINLDKILSQLSYHARFLNEILILYSESPHNVLEVQDYILIIVIIY